MKTLLAIILLFFIVQIAIAQSALGAGFYDDDLPLITYSGAWVRASGVQYYGGSAQSSTSPSDSLSFSYYGADVGLYIGNAIGGSTLLICVDSVCSAYNADSSSASVSLISLTGFEVGTHTVTVSQNVAGGWLLDAVYVAPVPAIITVEVTAEPDQTVVISEIDSQAVAWRYEITAGDIGVMLMLIALITITLVQGLIALWKR